MKYKCNDCDDEPPFTGTCELTLPTIAAKPKYCPIFDNAPCNWQEV